MKPSVLFFCASFTVGGVEKVLVNLANYFYKSNYPTSFLVCQNIGELNLHLKKEIKIYSLNRRVSKSFLPAFSFFRLRKPEIIISGPQFINILSVLILKFFLRYKSKLIITHHNFYDLDVKGLPFLSLFYKILIRNFYKHADVIVVVSNAVKYHLVDDIGVAEGKVKVIYNPVIDDNFDALVNEDFFHKWFLKKQNFKVLVCVGRLSKIKNQEALINLMPHLIEKVKCKLLLIGDGECREFLENLVLQLNLGDSVDFLGQVNNPLKYISHANLLVLPSVTETFSLVAVEAIAVGTPVISTPTLGVKEILENCEGCYFENINYADKFVNKIQELLNSENIVVNKDYVKRFDVNSIGKQYELLIQDDLDSTFLNRY